MWPNGRGLQSRLEGLGFNSQCWSCYITYTVVSRYFDTAGIRKKYHNIQTIELFSTNFKCFVVVGILIWYRNKQHFELLDIVIMRDYCTKFANTSTLDQTAFINPDIMGTWCTDQSFNQ